MTPPRQIGGIRYAAALALVFFLTIPAPAQMRNEYQVKAAFLLNFAKFVEWPPEVLRSPGDPIVTCVLGRDPFGHWLKDAVDGRSIDTHPLVLRHISKTTEAGTCQILFVSSLEPRRTWTALAEMTKTGVLTVGECEEAGDNNAIITLSLEGDHVRFEINTQAAEAGRMRISSRLLSLARTVKK